MTTRWIWLVPSQIWVIVDLGAVSAGRWPVDGGSSARIQHHLPGSPWSLYEGQDYGLAGLGLALTPVLDQGDGGGDRPQDIGGVRPWHGGAVG